MGERDQNSRWGEGRQQFTVIHSPLLSFLGTPDPAFDAGVDEVYVQQIGPDMDGFFTAWEREVLPQLRQ